MTDPAQHPQAESPLKFPRGNRTLLSMGRIASHLLAPAALLVAAVAAAAQSAPSRITPLSNPAAPVSRPSAPPPSPPADSATEDLTTYLDRSSKLKDDDIDGRLALARWCRDRQMWSQAVEMADQALYRDPGNRAAYLILQQVDDARALPDDPAAARTLTDEFSKRTGHPFSTRTTKHFLLCYDTTDAFAVKQGAAMEKVYDAFQYYFNMNTLRPEFLDKRLDAILFKARSDYLSYGQESEGANLSWTAGFYSQRTNRSSFFDDSTGTDLAGLTTQAGALKDKIDALNKDISAANRNSQLGLVTTLTVERNRAGEALAKLNNTIGNDVNILNKVKTMHEAAHQISFNMGIQSRAVDYPLWFSEGLACSFETEDSAGRRGPALINFGRIGVLKDALTAGTLPAIESVITSPPPPSTDEKATGMIYAEGWGLFHFLYKFHREGMEKYLLEYKSHAPFRRIDADERKVLFTKAFGSDLDDLNRKFIAYFKSAPARPN